MKNKKIPLRMCIGCQKMIPKKQLIRIVNNKEQGLLIDLSGKKNGRGAYICMEEDCFRDMTKNKKLEKVFNMKIESNFMMDIEKVLNEKNK